MQKDNIFQGQYKKISVEKKIGQFLISDPYLNCIISSSALFTETRCDTFPTWQFYKLKP